MSDSSIPLPLTTNRNVWVSMVLIASILCGIVMILFYFQELFIVILLGACLVELFDKSLNIFNKYTKKYTKKQKQVIAVILILICGIIISYFMIQIANISNLLLNLEALQKMIETGMQMLMNLLSEFPENVMDRISDIIDSIINKSYSYIGLILSQAFLFTLMIVLICPIMFKMYLRDTDRIKKTLKGYVPARFEKEVYHTASEILTQSNNFFVAKIIESLCISIISCIGFYIIGLPGWLFLGILAGLMNNVPYIGPMFAAVLPTIVGFVIGWKIAVLAIAVCAIAQIIDNFYLVPYMISKKTSVNPFTTVLLVLIFSQIFGAVGMILSIPIYIIFKIIMIESYKLLIRIFPESVGN